MGPRGQFRHRLHRADLVVDLHHRDQPGALGDRHRRIDQPCTVHRQHGERGIVKPRGVEHGGVLDGRNRQAPPPDPAIARLSASVAPEVKITRPPGGNSAATCARAASTAAAARGPGGVGYADWHSRRGSSGPASQGSIAARASGASGVVA
jgi:hypothetical protein